MSLFPAIYGWPSFGAAFSPIAPAAPETPVKAEDGIDRSFFSVSAGNWPSGFDKAPPLTVQLIWEMRRDPTIALAFAVTTAPILAGNQTVEIADDMGDPEEANRRKGEASKIFLPFMDKVLTAAVECLHFGNWLQEVVWDLKEVATAVPPAKPVAGSAPPAPVRQSRNLMVPVAFRSFLPGEAILYRDKYRDFAGFKVNNEYRDARYAFLCVNDSHIDAIFGRSRDENCRKAWWRGEKSEESADRAERKASGMQMVIEALMGMTWVGPDGTTQGLKAIVQSLTDAAVKGDTIVVPKTPFSAQACERNPDLLDKTAFNVKQLDWGNIGPALLAHLERLGRQDRLIMRGWRRPEREAMEGQFGTKAEAGTHGQIGTTDSELVHSMIAGQFSAQTLDTYLVANYGPEAKGTLYLKPAPLSDPQQTFLQALATAIATNPTDGPELIREADKRALLQRVEVPLRDAHEVEAERRQAQKDAAALRQKQLDAAKQATANGNGHPNGNPKLAASVERLAMLMGDE